MLSKPVYEALPYCYVAIGSVTLLLLDQPLAQLSAVIIYLLGSKVYMLRSNNRRTDAKKRRKKGWIPSPLYEHIPALCLLIAILLSKLNSKAAPVFALCLCSYGLYVFFRRLSYRKHKYFESKCL